jgi:hypothetical protein
VRGKTSGVLPEQRFLVVQEFQRLAVVHVREQPRREVLVVHPANGGAVEVLGDGNAVVETDL